MPPLLAVVVIVLLGLSVGSFLALCTRRVPLDRSLSYPGSTCPECGTPIAWYDLIPIVSYLALGGRARCCRARIGLRYPLIEIVTTLVFLALYRRYGLSWNAFAAGVFASFLIVVTVIDLDYHLIFNKMTYPAMILSVIAAGIGHGDRAGDFWGERVIHSLVWMALMYVGFAFIASFGRVLFKGDALGEGDVKLAAVIGAYFGSGLAVTALVMGLASAGGVNLLLLALRRVTLKSQVAFGPYLVFGTMMVLLFAPELKVLSERLTQ